MANPRKPTSLQLLRGNPGRRPLPAGEPKPEVREPNMPSYLCPMARKTWRRLAPTYTSLGILTVVDGEAFAALCMAEATLARINKALRECKYKVLSEKVSFLEQKSDEGRSNEVMAVEVKINPLIAQQRLALQTLRFWCQEFGVTPSSRGKVSVPRTDAPDPLGDF